MGILKIYFLSPYFMKNIKKFFMLFLATACFFTGFHGAVQAYPSKEQFPPNSIQAFWGCHFKVNNPHNSAHERGKINVVAQFTCNAPVVQIDMIVQLARDGYIVSTEHFIGSGVSSFEGNASTPCVSGMYQGGAVAVITFPPGSASTSRTLHANSNQIYLTCS